MSFTFNQYGSAWGGSSPNPPSDTVIGPDKNLWGACGDGKLYKFDVTTLTTTGYTITGALSLINLATDGTFIYAADQNPSGSALPIVWKFDPSTNTSSAFFTPSDFENGRSIYYDASGPYLWLTAGGGPFRQIDLTGALLNSYAGPFCSGGGALANRRVLGKWERLEP